MSAEFEIMGVTTTTETAFQQLKEDALDISQYTEAAIMATIYDINRNSGTTVISLETAVDNNDDRYVELADIASLTSDPASTPSTHYIYLSGPGVAETGQPGFARFLRVNITQASGGTITLDVKAILKP